MLQKLHFPLLFLLLSGIPAQAQDYIATKLELFENKEEVFVEELAVDRVGFIWYISKGSVYRFDGYHSLPLMESLPQKEGTKGIFRHVLADGEDQLWIAGMNDLHRFDLKTWKFTDISGAKLPKGYDLEILNIKKSQSGQVLVRYNNGQVAIIQNGTVQQIVSLYPQETNLNPTPSIWSFEFWKGRAWFGDSEGRLYSMSLEKPYKVKTYIFKGLNSSIEQIIPQEGRLVLVDLWRSRFFQVNFLESGELSFIKIPEYYSEEEVWAMKWDYELNRDGESSNKRKNTIGKKEDFIKNFLDSNNIVDINVLTNLDKDLILATSSGIYAIYEKLEGLTSLVPANSVNKSVRGIYQFQDNSIFLCSYGGAEFIEPGGTRHFFPNLRGGYAIIPLDENRILISIQGGIPIVFNKKGMGFGELDYKIPKAIANQGFLFPNYVLSMAQDEQSIYFGSLNSLWKLDKNTREAVPLLNRDNSTQLSKFRVNHISIENPGLLLSTSLGVFKHEAGSLEKIYPKEKTLGVYKHLLFRDTLWLATQGKGLIAIDGKGRELKQYTKNTGLSGNMVYSLVQANAYIMVGTGKGLSILKDGKIKKMDVSDGLLHNEFNRKSVFYSKENKTLFMGGLNGYTVFDMKQDWFEKKVDFENHISQTSILGTNNSRAEHNYSYPYLSGSTLKLSPRQKLLTISIGTPESYKTNQRPKYKIKGLLDAWQALPQGGQITLMDLSPGEYSLEIKASGQETGDLLNLDLKKMPAFHQTLGFKFLIFSIPVFLLWIWYRSRLKKIRREQALRAKIASDLHDDVGTILSTISMQAEYLQISKKEISKKNTLKKISDSSKNAIRAMGDIVWSLDARSDNWENFIVKMREFGHALFEESQIHFKLIVSGKPPKNLLQEDKQALYLIYKEALNNVHKHSGAKKAEAKLLFSDAGLVLTIKDNGKGYKPELEKSGQGIKNMEMRAKKIKAKFTLSQEEQGLQITLTKNFRKKSPFWG